MKARTLFAVVVFGALGGAEARTPLAAQTLTRVELLARDGRVEEARVELTDWWDAEWRGASRAQRQEALWYRGVLTLDPAQAETQFRRLAIEYPGGAWSARALLRLARSALLGDDVLLAARYFGDLARDYPASAARLEAEEWLAENQDLIESRRTEAVSAADEVALRADEGAPAGEQSPVAVATEDPPIQAEAPPAVQVDSDAPPPADSAVSSTSEISEDPDETPSSDEVELHGVQLGAFSSVDRATVFAERVEAAGFVPRLVRVPGSRLVRVRVGSFRDADTAQALYDRIVDAGFEAAVVRDVSSEEEIG